MVVSADAALEADNAAMIPAGAPCTVIPPDHGTEFIEFRNSEDYDTNFRSKNDAYWDRIAETRKACAAKWSRESQPYGLILVPDAPRRNP